MTGGEQNTRTKFSAIFFAAVMVLSMVAFSTAFVGGAAALSDNSGDGVSAGTNTTAVVTDQTYNLSIDSSDNILSTNGGNDNVTSINIDFSNFGTTGSPFTTVNDASNVSVNINGTEVTPSGITDNTANLNINVPQTTVAAGDTVNVTLQNVTNPVSAEGPTNVDVTLDDSGTNSTNVSLPYTTTQPNIDIEPNPGVTTVGSSVEYTVSLTDSNGNDISGANVSAIDTDDDLASTAGLTSANGDITAQGDTEFTTDGNGEATIELFNTTDSGTNSDGIGAFDFIVQDQLSANGNSTGTVVHVSSSQNTAFIEGEVSDDTLPFSKIDDSGNISITIETAAGNVGTTTLVDSVNLSDFDNLASNNQFVRSADFQEGANGSVDSYTINLETSQSQTYTVFAEPVGAIEGDFAAFDGPTQEIGPGQSSTRNIRLERLIEPDDIEVIDVSPGSQADIGETVDVTVEVTTADTGTAGTPLANTPVVASVNNTETTNSGGVTGYSDVFIDGNGADETKNTNSSGQTTFSVNVSGTTQDIEQVINTQIDFTATEGDDVSTSQDLSFVPDIGDTGTISGEVDVIDGGIQLGTQSQFEAQSNVESQAGVQVHAVQVDRLETDTVGVDNTSNSEVEELNASVDLAGLDNINDFDDANVSINLEYASVSGNDTGLGEVRLDRGDQFRVVTFVDGEEVVQDPRSDYLTHTPTGVELIENETDQSVEVHSARSSSTRSFELSFLNDLDNYQVQQKVVISNESSGESVTAYKNITVVTNLAGSPSTQLNTEDVFDASNDLTFEGIDERYNNETDPKRAIPTDTTNAQGNYELFNLPVNVDNTREYVVIAGGSDTGSANTEYGFANFRGYSFVDVSANADQTANGQLNTDLSVQEYEPLDNFVYNLDVTVDNGDKFAEAPVGDSVSVEVSATRREPGVTDDEPAGGIEIELDVLNSEVGDLAETTVTTDGDGNATTTFAGDSPQVGETNISATFETSGEVFTTVNGEQATVEVFQDAQITGDVVDDSSPSNNLPGADVTLTEENATGTFVEIASTTAGPEGSFSFTGADGVRSGENYTVEATFTDEEGNEGTGFASITEIPGGTTNADIVIEDVIAPEGFQVQQDSLQAPANASPGDEIEVSANVTNTAGSEATSPVTFFFNDSDVATQDITLDAGETDRVSFTVTVPNVTDGNYEHGIETDISSATATLTVDSDGSDAPTNPEERALQLTGVNNASELTQDDVTAAITRFERNESANGVDPTQDDVTTVITLFERN